MITEGRRGTFVAPSDSAGLTAAGEAAAEYAAAARRLGLGLTEATLLVERAWTNTR